MLEFTDTHTHLYDAAFKDDDGMDDAVRRAVEAGVTRMIIPDESAGERKKMLELCGRWPGTLFPCIGVHPEEIGSDWIEDVDKVRSSASELGESIVAIGETGLDLYWSREREKEQEEAFRAQIEIAAELGLPLIIHCRDAIQPMFRILESYRGRGLRGVFHAFSGSVETFRQLQKYGDWYVGIGGVLTFRKASIAESVREIPIERILLETDSPYLTPVPHRGERNESAYIPFIAGFLAERKSMKISDVAVITTENATRLFKLKQRERAL